MARRGWKTIVGLSILVGCVAVTVSAHATLWQTDILRNGRQFMYSSSAINFNVRLAPYSGLTNQLWTARTEPNQPGYFRFVAGFSNTPPYVVDIRNSTFVDGVQTYPLNGGANQSWLPVLRFWDATGAACYSFHSRLNHNMVLGATDDLRLPPEQRTLWVEVQVYAQLQGQHWCAYVDGLTPQNPRPF